MRKRRFITPKIIDIRTRSRGWVTAGRGSARAGPVRPLRFWLILCNFRVFFSGLWLFVSCYLSTDAAGLPIWSKNWPVNYRKMINTLRDINNFRMYIFFPHSAWLNTILYFCPHSARLKNCLFTFSAKKDYFFLLCAFAENVFSAFHTAE